MYPAKCENGEKCDRPLSLLGTVSFAFGESFWRDWLGGHFGIQLKEFFQPLRVAPLNVLNEAVIAVDTL
jgi:hypothetical protein